MTIKDGSDSSFSCLCGKHSIEQLEVHPEDIAILRLKAENAALKEELGKAERFREAVRKQDLSEEYPHWVLEADRREMFNLWPKPKV
jgi:hypothetical protein